jgi:hypothetical protein
MYKFVIRELLAKNIPEQQILLSLERHMKCGMGSAGAARSTTSTAARTAPSSTTPM